MARINRFEDLEAWRLAREITRQVYVLSKRERLSRDFALRDQIRRSAVSIMSNIAEGFERDGDREFANFLSIAKGSLGELRSQLYAALDQNYLTAEEFHGIVELTDRNSRQISGLMKYLRTSELRGAKFRATAATEQGTRDRGPGTH
jgi:four helix bundle protein